MLPLSSFMGLRLRQSVREEEGSKKGGNYNFMLNAGLYLFLHAEVPVVAGIKQYTTNCNNGS
ncbi:hypothetical protein C7N43_21130 [Sphingobacteriales bacterium UPWRP_1]|nr:hypothetical protein BVG80_16005 [Sphingobacteriales bacterium TSM_CSM]PSJ74977.1 hypothetical protein C7N43_21130 [Sphingobacteriales bacterium UPWRP_1]